MGWVVLGRVKTNQWKRGIVSMRSWVTDTSLRFMSNFHCCYCDKVKDLYTFGGRFHITLYKLCRQPAIFKNIAENSSASFSVAFDLFPCSQFPRGFYHDLMMWDAPSNNRVRKQPCMWWEDQTKSAFLYFSRTLEFLSIIYIWGFWALTKKIMFAFALHPKGKWWITASETAFIATERVCELFKHFPDKLHYKTFEVFWGNT